MANVFDQFDEAPSAAAAGSRSAPSGNVFDQFDAPAGAGPMGTGEAFLRGAEQGATLGFGDEARGILAASPMMESVQGSDANTAGGALSRFAAWNVRNSPLALISRGAEGAYNYVTGQAGAEAKYDQAAGQNRPELAQARTEHPWATGGGEIVGGVAATLPLMAVGPAGAAPMVAQIKNGAAVGAGLGAVQGFGQGEGGFLNRAESGGYGLAGGAVGGAVGAPVAAGVGSLARQGMALLPQRAAGMGPAATREAVNALGEAGPQQVQGRLAELGPDAMLLDAAQPFLGRAQGLAVEPGAPG